MANWIEIVDGDRTLFINLDNVNDVVWNDMGEWAVIYSDNRTVKALTGKQAQLLVRALKGRSEKYV